MAGVAGVPRPPDGDGTVVIGKTLSKYRVLEKLGQGGMGAVYRAEDTRLGRQVAIKLLPADAGLEAEARRRMLEEARAVARLDHPNICTLYEFDEADGQPFIVMQLVEGGSLRQALAGGPLDEDRVRALVAAVGAALSAAHARNIVHRDVKAENILIARDGTFKLADFGLALLDHDTRLTRAGMMVGTPQVMAPEQITTNTATPASDEFSLGVVVYECLTGSRPFEGDSLPAILHAVLNSAPVPPSVRRRELSPRWDEIVLRALEKDPGARHDSIAEFTAAVAATGTTKAATAPTGPPRSLAVLYFDNLSSDPESDYFCAGITEDLLTDLSKVAGLGVASRNAVGRYRGKTVDIPRIAAELGVAAVLEGSMRKAGNRVRINAQLIDASNGMHLWADRYDRTLDDVFAVQDDITASIAGALRATLGAGRSSDILQARPASVQAYDEYLRGRDLYARYEEDEMHRAIEHFEAAVRVDPGYALAWAGIADACGQMVDKAWDLDRTWSERGEAAGRRAVELAPQLAETHKALALTLSVQGRKAEARTHLLAALEANPRFVPALANMGSMRMDEGDFAGNERCLRRATEYDPTYGYLLALLMFISLSTGRWAEALSLSYAVQRWGGGKSMLLTAHYGRFVAHLWSQRWAAAGREVDALVRVGLPGEDGSVAALCIETARGARPATLPPIPERSVLYFTTDLHFLLGILARNPAHTVAALRRAEAVDPYSWTSLPVWVRAHLGMPSEVRYSPELREWLGDRGRAIVWPAEAPPLPAEIRADFGEVRVESGIPPSEGLP